MSSTKQNQSRGEVAEFSPGATIEAGFNFDHDDDFFIPNKDPAYVYRHVAKHNVEKRKDFDGYEICDDKKSHLPGMVVMRCRKETHDRRKAKQRKRAAVNTGMDPSRIEGGFAHPEHGTTTERGQR